MAGQSRKWMIVVATVWIQAFTGTNFDFSSYSSELKSAMGISQMQLNYLATASDLGKALGWSSGLALAYLPLPAVLFLAAALGLAAYGAQWLLVTARISLSYLPMFLLCLLAGCSICWFNTVSFVLCIRNFPVNRALALSLTISFNGVSAALFTLVANAVGRSPSTYLLLNATLPLLASVAALLLIIRPPPVSTTHPATPDAARRDSHIFLLLHVLAFLTGIYLLLLNPASSNASNARMLLGGAIALLALPLCTPGVVIARDWARRTIYSGFQLDGASPGFDPTDPEEVELRKGLIGSGDGIHGETIDSSKEEEGRGPSSPRWWCWCCNKVMAKDRVAVLGEEHGVRKLARRIDFWLYYVAYFCGATVGLVYSNNLGQIAQSLGLASETNKIVTVYSSCSFFGRLLSAAPDFLRGKLRFARTGWMAIAVLPMPVAFFLLAKAGDWRVLLGGTALLGLSSGFIFAAAVSVTSELFGPNGVGVNHNILITNIPLGSLLYGLLAALVYDANGKALREGMVVKVCMGRGCYAETFLWWGCITLVGLTASFALFLRTRSAYEVSEQGLERAQTNGEDFPASCG